MQLYKTGRTRDELACDVCKSGLRQLQECIMPQTLWNNVVF
jgi:hypothetical protein